MTMGIHKTSDKLLLAMGAGAVVLLCSIYLALYGQFRHGHIFSRQQLLDRGFARYSLPKPSVLSLKGTVWVNFYPSDSFYIELPKLDNPADKPWLTGQVGPEESLQLPQYRESGDTLLISGSFAETLHRPFADPAYRNHLPQVNIYGRAISDIQLLNGQLMLNGSASASTAPSIRLTAVNSTVWVADLNEPNSTPVSRTYFDSLDIRLSNSVLLLNHSAAIRTAGIHLDGNSELNDRWSTAGQLKIAGADSSHIGLAGNNLEHAIINIH